MLELTLLEGRIHKVQIIAAKCKVQIAIIKPNPKKGNLIHKRNLTVGNKLGLGKEYAGC